MSEYSTFNAHAQEPTTTIRSPAIARILTNHHDDISVKPDDLIRQMHDLQAKVLKFETDCKNSNMMLPIYKIIITIIKDKLKEIESSLEQQNNTLERSDSIRPPAPMLERSDSIRLPAPMLERSDSIRPPAPMLERSDSIRPPAPMLERSDSIRPPALIRTNSRMLIDQCDPFQMNQRDTGTFPTIYEMNDVNKFPTLKPSDHDWFPAPSSS
jgi:hypothetical protein